MALGWLYGFCGVRCVDSSSGAGIRHVLEKRNSFFDMVNGVVSGEVVLFLVLALSNFPATYFIEVTR